MAWPCVASADPISAITLTSVLISLAASAAATGASLLLSRLLTPKPQSQVTGKMTGNMQLSDSTWNVRKPEFFGHRLADGIGGSKLGINIIWMNREGIREHREIVQSGPGGGGGKGPPKPPPETRITYDCDIACLVGKGPGRILQIKFNEDIVYNVPATGTTGQITGLLDPDFPAEDPYDHEALPDPFGLDTNPRERHNLAPVIDPVDGSIGGTVVGGAYAGIRIYEGNEDQEPDPVIALDVDAIYGADSTPAYIGDCYFRVSGLSITKYNGMPNITVVVEHTELHTVEEILVYQITQAGLLAGDVDFSVCASTESRGYLLVDLQPAKKVMEDFAMIYNFDFTETPDGIILAADLTDRTIIATLGNEELGAYVSDGQNQPPIDLVVTKIPDESQAWRYCTVTFFNPLLQWQNDSRQDVYPFTTSQHDEQVSVYATMLPDEAFHVAQRMMQMSWAAIAPHSFVLLDKWIWLFCTNRIVIPISGINTAVRLMEIQGSAPGVLKCSAVTDELHIFAGASLTPTPPAVDVSVSANTIATFLDIPLLHPQALPGVYIAATCKDRSSGQWPGALAIRYKNDVAQQMTTFVAPCTMGRANGVMDDVPSDWADARNNFVRAFFGGTVAGGSAGTGALNREPDTVFELPKWSDQLRDNDPVAVGQVMGQNLFFTAEYLARARTDTEFVTDLYSAFYDRGPDGPGLSFWVGELGSPHFAPRLTVLNAFATAAEYHDRCQVAAAEFFDDDATTQVDLFNEQELTSVTDDEARSGFNACVIGGEVCVVAVWERDNTKPSRWNGSHILRRLKGTDAASATHVNHERFVQMDSAVRFVQLDPLEAGVTRTWKVQTVGQRIEDCAEIAVTWFGVNIPSDPNVEAHVPTLGAAATINKDITASWVIYTPKPGMFGGTITDLQILIYSDSGGTTLVRTVIGSVSGRSIVTQTSANSYIRYRWRNQSNENIGNGRGWSDLSAVSTVAYGSSSGTQNTSDSGIIVPPDIDPWDGGDRGGCFVAGTMLRIPGGVQAIETFEQGMLIRVFDFDLGRLVDSVVTRVEVHPGMMTRQLLTQAGRAARLTDEQPLATGNGRQFLRLDLLQLGNDMLGVVGENEKPERDRVSTIGTPEIHDTFHLHVAHKDHNYVLENGLIAHNIKPAQP